MNIVKATRKMLAYHSMRESSYREVPESEMILSIEDEDTLNVILENENSHPLRKFLKQNRLKLITILFSLTLALIYRLFVHQDGKNPALSSILIIPALLILGLYAATLFEHAVLKVLQLLSNPDSSMGAVDALSSRLRFLILFGFVNYYAIPFWLEEPHFGDDFLRLFFRASFVIALSWILKELGYAIIRKFAFVSTLKSDLYNLRAIKDSIWFVCCPNTASRHRLMKMWREQAAQRASFDRKVAELRSCKMDLPLVDINGGAEWDFSLKESFHVASTTKMRAIAQFMAKRLFEGGSEMNFAKWSQMFPSATSASRAWTLLFKDISQSQPIHAEEFVWALIQAFERLVHLSNRALNLDNLLNVVLIGINSIFYLMIGSYVLFAAGVDLSAMVVTFATAFASLTFAFSGMITRIFESMIWVFITKAVEVGDLVQLNNEDFTILRIRLMSSDLRAGDGRVMTIPNGILAQNPIYNMRLTSSAVVSIRFQVSYSCSRDKLTLLKKGIESYVQKNSEIWRYPMDLRVTDLIDSSSWTVIAILHHRLNWQQKNIIAEDRFEIANEIRNLINDLGIGYRDPDKYVDASAPSQSMTTNALPTNNISSFQK